MKINIKRSLFLIAIFFLLVDLSHAQEIGCEKDEFKGSGYCWITLEDIEVDTGKVTGVHGSLSAYYYETGDITNKTKIKFAITVWHTSKDWYWKGSEKIYFLVDGKRIVREKVKSARFGTKNKKRTGDYSFPLSSENVKEISQAEEVRFKIANSEMRLTQKHLNAFKKMIDKINRDDFFPKNR